MENMTGKMPLHKEAKIWGNRLFHRLNIAPINDERFYKQAAEEISTEGTRAGLWAKSFADSSGDEKKAMALYLRYRVEQIAEEEMRIIEQQKASINDKNTDKLLKLAEKRKLDVNSSEITLIHKILIGLPLLMLVIGIVRALVNH